MVSVVLKDKVIGLINETKSDMGIKLNVTAKIQNTLTLKVNIQSCSIDLKSNLLETVKMTLEKGGLIGTHREYLQNILEDAEKNKNIQSQVHCDVHHLKKLFSGDALKLLEQIHKNIRCEYYCDSDIGRDYIDIGYYYHLTIGNNKTGFKVI
ncbi:hypothetical protein ACQWTT_001176 [Acinetobacter baumannii]